MTPKTPNIDRDEAQEIIVTLALIQRALEEMTKRVDDHHKALFGNGNPENSIVWAVKSLSDNISKLEQTIELYHREELTRFEMTQKIATQAKEIADNLTNKDENLSWKQWGKKFVMKWFPLTVTAIVLIIAFKKPLIDLLILLGKVVEKW